MNEIINNLKSIIFLIGIVTTLYLIFKYFIKPTLKKNEEDDKEKIFKIETLCQLHPSINKLYKDFEQIQNSKYLDSEMYHSEHYIKEARHNIFGRKTFVFDEYDIKFFTEKILNKINELENTNNSEIQLLIQKVKAKKELYNTENKNRIAEKEYLTIHCGKTLNELFPIYATFRRDNQFSLKNEEEIKNKLNFITTYPYNNSDILFVKLIDYGILLKKTIDKNDFYYIDKKY